MKLDSKRLGGKWYLDYSKRKIYSDFYTIWQPESKSVVERTAIYNINSAKSYNSKIFKPTFIQVDQIKRHSSPWLDEFWGLISKFCVEFLSITIEHLYQSVVPLTNSMF